MIIGLTGRIASGKNEAAKLLADRGFEIIDVDCVGHESLTDPATVKRLTSLFGSVILINNEISRLKLSELVFSDKSKLKQLETVLHPVMVEKIKSIIQDTSKSFVINAAILYEMKLDLLCDEIWVVDTPDADIIQRLRNKGLSDDHIQSRLETQMSRNEYSQRADRVIRNKGSLLDLKQQIDAYLDEAINN
ncbi:MAG TPA: dephospho-CoA kinase [Candidatus Margulisbacteria bacterium]|nr:MAG: dephospho-CoA kinase [Candidatus Margulisbacteria bacterium GWF2_38_17]OGI07335.1 MAG: dephospho-CoA kinase [Candidatus Margulisbacteria bacterium GWE2_39_32]HCT86013.1 dephospho-CoA kinase [Candidatus Margulisiibacteriota bacterium]